MACASKIHRLCSLHLTLAYLDPEHWSPISAQEQHDLATVNIDQRIADAVDERTRLYQAGYGAFPSLAATPWATHIPAGRYALDLPGDPYATEDGLTYLHIAHGQPGTRHDGELFLDDSDGIHWHRDDRGHVRRTDRDRILRALAADGIAQAARRYGYRHGVCGACRRELSDPLAVELGACPRCSLAARAADQRIAAEMAQTEDAGAAPTPQS